MDVKEFFSKNKSHNVSDDAKAEEVCAETQEKTSSELNNGTGKKTQIYNLIILDKSGSMNCIADAAISGFNETIAGVRVAQEKFKETQEHFVSLMIFCDCEKKMVYRNTPIAEVPDLTSKEYQPCCSTPLYDAMGLSLNDLYNEIHEKEDATAVVTIITDGMENASREFDGNAINALVKKLTEEEGWKFSYIGTNQNVHEVAASMAIPSSMSFEYNRKGMSAAWRKERNAKMRYFEMLNEEDPFFMTESSAERKIARAKRNKCSKFFLEEDDIKERITSEHIENLPNNGVFVFGSDITGAHTGGAARYAVEKFGAVVGCAEGLQGQSYAIPTTGVSLSEMNAAVERFIDFARQHPELTFHVTRIGCGNAGYDVSEIARMFIFAANYSNIHLPKDFWSFVL